MDKKIQSLLYLVGGVIAIFIILRVLRTGRRRTKQVSKADAEKAIQNLRTLEQFNPDFQLNKSFARITDNGADLYAEELRKAVRGFGTNEERIYSTFSKLKNKANISEIATRYYLKFRRDLRTDILRDLNNKEKVILYNIIMKLPNIS